ncbi:MAG: hypothetical protein A2Y23_14225 [Clostridiales bacterium GWB2_37_7]|nr:MAG: hypothetical protein A2Y23_14225 [Clostridiales bacterium GWB2_37_7]
MRLGVSIQQILDANPNINPLNLIPGTNISIPLVDYSDGTKKIYNILGSTTVLSQQQTDNITRWRYNIIKLANDNPDSIIINGPILEKQVCLTFDDGADLVITPKVLDLLNKYNVKASFFFTGHNVDKYKDVAIRANQEGHSLLSHSYYHPNFAKEGLDYIKREILMTEDRFSQVIGKRPAIIRPPFGSIDDRVLSAFRETNNKAVIWSIDSMDWAQNISKDNIIRNVLNNVRPGDIVLMHSYSTLNLILEALPIIILGLKNKGYKLVDIGELLNIPIYK